MQNLDLIEIAGPKAKDYIVINKFCRTLEIRMGSLVGTLAAHDAEDLLRALEVALFELQDTLDNEKVRDMFKRD